MSDKIVFAALDEMKLTGITSKTIDDIRKLALVNEDVYEHVLMWFEARIEQYLVMESLTKLIQREKN